MSQIHIIRNDEDRTICKRTAIRGRLTETEYNVLKEKGNLRRTKKKSNGSAVCQECERKL